MKEAKPVFSVLRPGNWPKVSGLLAVVSAFVCSEAVLGSSVPYLRALHPAPLRWQTEKAPNWNALNALGPLPDSSSETGSGKTTGGSTNSPVMIETTSPNRLNSNDNAAQLSPLFPGFLTAVQNEAAPPEPVEPPAEPTAPQVVQPQGLVPLLILPAVVQTNRQSTVVMPMTFSPAQPPMVPSSTATFTQDTP